MDVERAVALRATGQCGVFGDRQVVEVGGDSRLIARRVASGRWLRPAPGALAFPGHPATFERSLWVVVFASSPAAVVSHRSAAALHRIDDYPRNRFDVTEPRGTHLDRPVARVHQTSMPPTVVRIGGLPVTTLERTVIDLGKVSSARRLGPAVESLILDGRTTLERLRREFLALARQGRNGTTVARQVLDDRANAPGPSRRRLEQALDAILATIPGPPPRREAPLPGREWAPSRVDRRYDDPKLIVEGDGRRWHARSADFVRDRQRDREALGAGYPTVRYAYEELVSDPDGVRAELLALLGR